LNSEVRFHLSLPPHDNVIELYRVEYKKDVLFLIMELVEGTSLAELMVTHPAFTSKSWDSHNTHIKDIYGSVVKAIDHCHRHGLYHRDIKPENVVINVHETEWSMWFFVKVIDFGLATDQLQSKDVFCGTLRYMSPEAINYRDEQQVDKNDVSNVTAALPAATTTINSAAADVWSLGVLLFRLLNPINQMDVTMFWKVASMNDIVFEKYASDAKDFIAKLPFTDIVRKILGQALVIDPKRRISMSRLAELVSNVTMYVST
ncbi:kinase-like protein, partial [Ramicandelaber brevisporus]